MGEYSYILEQQGETTSEKLAEFTAAIGWRDELATYRIAQDEYEMRAAAAAEQGISLLDEPPYTAEELAALDAESAAYYEAFAANYVATAAFPGSGSGTQSDPYIITNRAELESIADDLTAYYRLGNDIDLGGSGSPWTPIGTSSAPFSGTLDGNGYTIAGMYISAEDSADTRIGFFGETLSATINDIGISGAVIHLSADSVGPTGCLVAKSMGTTISGVVVDQSSIIFFDRFWFSAEAGLIIGYSYDPACIISDCIVSNCAVQVQRTKKEQTYAIGGAVGRTGNRITSSLQISSTYILNFELQTNLPIVASYWANTFGGIAGGLENGSTGMTVSSCVVLGDTSLTAPTTPGRIWGNGVSSGTNNYADPNVLVNSATVSGGTSSNRNGADVYPSTYHSQAFWQNTLGWDFDTVWYWDDTTNLPKLQAFSREPKFPLNVEIGSPKYTTVSQINYNAGALASVLVTPTTSGTTPVSNSYYTFQSQDGQYWITAYVDKWTDNGGTWTADLRWSSSNTDTLPAQSICWCVWTKEYYQSIVDRLSS